jgi:hypothetical protein
VLYEQFVTLVTEQPSVINYLRISDEIHSKVSGCVNRCSMWFWSEVILMCCI